MLCLLGLSFDLLRLSLIHQLHLTMDLDHLERTSAIALYMNGD